MQNEWIIYQRTIRVIALIAAAIALIAVVASNGHSVLAEQNGQPVADLQQEKHSPDVMAEPTPEPSPPAPRTPALQTAPVPAQCSGTDCTISSRAGWQQTPLTLRQGEQFSIAYLGGTWTVDKRNWPLVGPGGYSSDMDQQIGYPLCKVDSRWPYAALLGKVGEGAVFLADGGGTFTAERDGALYLQINDAVMCQGDNEGTVSVRVTKPSCARLFVSPAFKEIAPGGTGTTEVKVADVANLYGVQFRVSFDPSVVQVVDADPNTAGVQMGVGSLFTGKNHYVARNSANNTTGVGEFVVTLVAPAVPITGSGTLAIVNWQGVKAGQSAITLTLTGLAPASLPICHTIENGSLRVVSSGPVVSGRILLQGARDHSGTSVFLTEAPRTCLTGLCFQELSNVPLSTTDRDGRFEVSPFPGRNYPWLWAYHACYLTGVKRWPQGDVRALTLPAGDLNEDNCINVYDLVKMSSCYGTTSCSCADFNQDGSVDIFDLAVVARNFGKCGSVDDWQP